MRAISLHDKDEIATLLGGNPFLHLYSIGDLDDFFWPHTTWYGSGQAVAPLLLYTGVDLPVLLALTDEPSSPSKELLRSVLPVLPRRFYAHLSEGLAEVLSAEYQVHSHGTYYKMGLKRKELLERVESSEEAARIRGEDVPELKALYAASYPGNSFDPRMVETGHYYGVRRGGRLVSAAGVHVYSPTYGVAAIGNVTTLPEMRRQGLGTKVTAAVCRSLLHSVDRVGLNVKADNSGAIACYEMLGFEKIATYEECSVEAKC